MITIKNKAALDKMEQAGQLLAAIFEQLPTRVIVGVHTLALDAWISEQLYASCLKSEMKGYCGYQHVSCISVNDEVVHGIPSIEKVLKRGDVVKIDVCASWKSYCADMARTFFVADVDDAYQRFSATASKSLEKGIAQAQPGKRLSDISAAIGKEIESHGYGVVRDFAGHGIGKRMHEDPEILNYGQAGRGPILQPGMVFALEPMLTYGDYRVYVADDGWTVRTVDGSVAVHVEDTVAITEKGPKILTRIQN